MQQGSPKGHEVKKAIRQQRALDMRMMGYSYRAIAKDTGVSEGTAYNDVQSSLASLDQVKKGQAERLRELELVKLDHAETRLAKHINNGDVKAILAMVRISERRAKLTGLDAPTKAEISGPMKFTLDIGTLGENEDEE
jgi:transposase